MEICGGRFRRPWRPRRRRSRVSERPDLAIADKPGSIEGDAWRLEILGDKDAVAYAGPFVVDHNHALAKGLSLQNVVWSASAKTLPGGLPIVTAGNVPLLSEGEDVAGRRRLQMAFAADLSNLQDMPDWPIFFANLIEWRRGGLPGVAAPNVRLGQTVAIAVAGEAKRVEVVSPSKIRRELDVRGRQVAVPADHVGLYAIKTPDVEYEFSCNALSRDESDLGECQSGRWGNWGDSPTHQDRHVGLGWMFLLAALATMAAHMAVVAKDPGGAAHDACRSILAGVGDSAGDVAVVVAAPLAVVDRPARARLRRWRCWRCAACACGCPCGPARWCSWRTAVCRCRWAARRRSRRPPTSSIPQCIPATSSRWFPSPRPRRWSSRRNRASSPASPRRSAARLPAWPMGSIWRCR